MGTDTKCKCGNILKPLELPSFGGGSFSVPAAVMCDECFAKSEKDAGVAAIRAYVQGLIDNKVVPYADHDPTLANLPLRDMVGSSVFADHKIHSRGVYIHGPAGIWKTRALSACALTAARRGYTVEWLDCPVLLCEYSEAVSDTMHRAAALINRCTRPDIFVIDDFGKGVVTQRGAELLYNIINQRIVRGKPVWYTANKPPSMVKGWIKYDEAGYAQSIIRRITEYCQVIKSKTKGGKEA